MSNLVIVESPSKAKKIQGYLGKGWSVLASMGHVRDLPPKALGVDIEHGFAPTYEAAKGKAKVLTQLRAAAKGAEAIYLATDPDREGEAIAWHVLESLGTTARKKPIFRVTFHEITPAAIRAAFAAPRQLDMALVESQQARRVLDRLVGWKVSPVLGRVFGTSLSAGRVQSVAVRLVVEREQAIEQFIPEQSWTLDARFERQQGARERFAARLSALLDPADKALDPKKLPTERAQSLATELSEPALAWQVEAVATTERRRPPPPPFITSTLQQKAASTLSLGPKQAMKVAQALYEQGKITYMRTDSPAVSAEAQRSARTVIERLFGAATLPDRPPRYRARGNAQEAHECIRPTDPTLLPKNSGLSGSEAALYRLIWMRFIASQMQAALYDVTVATIRPAQASRPLPYAFEARGARLRLPGWLTVYGVQAGAGDEEDEDERAQPLPDLQRDEPLTLLEMAPTEHWTEPPPRYSEPSLIKALEKEGIGRPSTYASIMETIQQRGYVELTRKSLTPTPSGRAVTAFLGDYFPDLVALGFTRDMEAKLDEVAEGGRRWEALLEEFYAPLSERVAAARLARAEAPEARPSLAPPCPECGTPMEQKYGRYGSYQLCPACGHKPGAAKLLADRPCPRCGKPLAERRSRRGPFLGCSGYPACDYLEPLLTPTEQKRAQRRAPKGSASPKAAPPAAPSATGIHCPKCGRELVARTGKYGPFLACPGFPACRHIEKPGARK